MRKIKRPIAQISINISLCVVLCTALAPSAYADGDILSQCMQNYHGDAAGRLKCYDRLAAPASDTNPVSNEDAGANPNLALSTTAERSYLTKEWNLDDQSNRDPSKLGRIQPYRQTYLLLKKPATSIGSRIRQPLDTLR